MTRHTAMKNPACKEIVEIVTDYLDDALSSDERDRFEQHLTICTGCEVYLEQMRETIRLTGELREDAAPPEAMDQLRGPFRPSWWAGCRARPASAAGAAAGSGPQAEVLHHPVSRTGPLRQPAGRTGV